MTGEMHRGITATVDEVAESMVADLRDYLRQPSISATGEGFPAATHRAVRAVEAAGMRAEIWDTPGRPAVYGFAAGRPGAPTILIYGHYDVQPTGPAELWRTPPFEPAVRDGRIWARGAGDNKGQHLAHLQAVRLLGQGQPALPCTVKVILDGEEEIGSPHLAELIERRRPELNADVVIYSDGPVHSSGRWCVKHGVRGVLGVGLHVRCANRDVHSGNYGNVVPSAAWTLVHALASLRDATGQVAINGFYDDVTPLPEADRAALRLLPADSAAALDELGLAQLDPTGNGMSFYERLAELPTLTINGIQSGDLTRTIIPGEASARLDIRLVAGQRPDTEFRRIVEHLARHAPDVQVSKELAVPPARTPVDNAFTAPIAAAIAQVTGEEPLIIPALGGTLPTHVWTDVLGLPTLGIPLANVDEANHAPNENLELRRYLAGIAISMAVQCALGRRDGS